MESHQHVMDPEYVREILDGLTGDYDENDGDPWESVLSVDVAKRVRIILGVGGPTRYLDVMVSDGSVTSAEYYDSWAVPDTREIWYGSDEFAQCEQIIATLGYDQ